MKHLVAFLIVDSLNRLKFNLAHQRLAFCLTRPGLNSSKFFLSSWVGRGRKWNGTRREGWQDIASLSRNKTSHIPALLSTGEHSVSARQRNIKTLTATTNMWLDYLFLFRPDRDEWVTIFRENIMVGELLRLPVFGETFFIQTPFFKIHYWFVSIPLFLCWEISHVCSNTTAMSEFFLMTSIKTHFRNFKSYSSNCMLWKNSE